LVSDGRVTTEIVQHERGPYARITVENAAKANCLTTPIMTQLRDVFLALRDDDNLRLAVLTGEGERSFLGGANLHELKELTPAKARAFLTLLSEANTAIRNLPVPVIARINGVCIGAGLEVAVSCDLRIAAAHARLGMPEVALDLPSVVESALFPRMMGWGRTAWMIYRGDLLDADLAERWGLIEKRSAEGELDADVDELVDKILSNGVVGIRTQKALMRNWERMSLQDGILEGIDTIAEAVKTGESKRYINETLSGLNSNNTRE
jgi:enoyl-CoA hydratase